MSYSPCIFCREVPAGMSPFALAVRRRSWHAVALYLLVGAAETAAALPPLDRALLLLELDHGRSR